MVHAPWTVVWWNIESAEPALVPGAPTLYQLHVPSVTSIDFDLYLYETAEAVRYTTIHIMAKSPN